jgi:glycosyltransferase involved in cell wall biosynthesis
MTTAKRKILFLIPSLAGGGAERTLINMLSKTDYSKYEVDLISVLEKGPYLKEVPPEVNLITLFKNENVLRALSYLQKKTGVDQVFRLMMKRKIKKQYDVGISFLDSNFTDFLFFTDKISKRYSWIHSSYKSYKNFYKFYKDPVYRDKLVRDRYSKLDGIYFVSDDSRKEFIEIFGVFPKMEVIYNIIDSEMVSSKAEAEVEFDHSKFSFIAVGSLFPVKGFDRLIRAAKILRDKGYDFKVDILGRGSEEENLNKLVNELGIADNIVFHGFVSNPYPYMKAGEVFVMSSVSEALPTVLCEAMILGRPVVVTNCSGCRELVDMGKYGLMAEQDDEDLAAKMEIFLQDKKQLENYATLSKQRSGIFDTEQVMSKYREILNR